MEDLERSQYAAHAAIIQEDRVGLQRRSVWSAEPQVGSTVLVRILQLNLANHLVSLAPA